MMLGSWSRRWQVISRSAVCMILLHRSASSWYKLSTLTSVPPCDEAIPAKAWAPLPLPQIRSLILSVITSFLENWLNYKFNFVFTTSKPWRFSTNGSTAAGYSRPSNLNGWGQACCADNKRAPSITFCQSVETVILKSFVDIFLRIFFHKGKF